MAVVFDGTNDFLSNTSWGGVTAPPFSWAGWANKTTNSAMYPISMSLDSNNSHELLIDSAGNLRQRATVSGGSGGDSIRSGMVANQWHHCTGVSASSVDRKSYLDGVVGNTGEQDNDPAAATRIDIGAKDDQGASKFEGELCHWGAWNRVLLQAEITALAQGWSARFFSDGLVFLWEGFNLGEDDVYGLTLTESGTPAKSDDHAPIFSPASRAIEPQPPFAPVPDPPGVGSPLRYVKRRRIVRLDEFRRSG